MVLFYIFKNKYQNLDKTHENTVLNMEQIN